MKAPFPFYLFYQNAMKTRPALNFQAIGIARHFTRAPRRARTRMGWNYNADFADYAGPPGIRNLLTICHHRSVKSLDECFREADRQITCPLTCPDTALARFRSMHIKIDFNDF